jgi:NADH-quinone oxidoreductase subunit D
MFYERCLRGRACTPIISALAAQYQIFRQASDDIYSSDPFLKVCDDLEGLLIDNRILKQRNVDIGVVTLDDAWRLLSGVFVRAAAQWDLRKAQPYECYPEFDLAFQPQTW